MDNGCLSLTFPGLYREIELSAAENTEVRIGTVRGCAVRFARESVPGDFALRAVFDGKTWGLEAESGVFFRQDGPLMRRTLVLTHGARFSVCCEEGGATLCGGEFLIDFQGGVPDYCRYVRLDALRQLRIGGAPGCEITLTDPLVGTDTVRLDREPNGWRLQDGGARYGVTVNGSRVSGTVLLQDYDFFALAGHCFFLRGERLYTTKDRAMQIGLQAYEHRDSATRMTYPRLNRSTRIFCALPTDKPEIQDPPARQEPPEHNLLMTLLPTIAMLVVTVLLRGLLGGGGVFIIFSACTMSIGALTSVLSYFHQKKKSGEGERRRVAGYTDYLNRKEAELQALRSRETAALEQNTPAMEETLRTVWRFDGRLFERTPDDPDFLSVRLGTGPRESICPVSCRHQEYRSVEDPLTEWPAQMAARYRYLPQAPALLDLHKNPASGLVGTPEEIRDTVRLMTIDLCVRHSYQEVQLFWFLPEEGLQDWRFLRLLRHGNSPAYGLHNLAFDAESCKNLADFLYRELSERENSRTPVTLPAFVVFVLAPYDLPHHPISRFFGGAPGVSFVFCRRAKELLPRCTALVRLGAQPAIIDAAGGGVISPFQPDFLPQESAERAAVKLAAVTVAEVSPEDQLPRSVTLFRLLRICSAEDLDFGKNWASAEVYRSMAAPLGLCASGETVSLDLHEKAHGPHGLVAGTTGSGKSELLQSYILSMAVRFPPTEVAFVLIDFKGGGMANQLRGLPHLAGSITDIDGREVERSLLSIRAELNRRKERFAAAGVNHIDAYLKKYRAGETKIPLPHLILIVDEFAELKTDQPEFMKELISAARIGRSLGVHLILATQKPSGVVDDQIWSNSRFRLCLKVQTPEDSKEMLKTPLAAEIREPGRAYLQVGANEIFELFQSAYSGAPADSELASDTRAYRIDLVAPDGQREPFFVRRAEKAARVRETQLQAIVRAAAAHCERSGAAKIPGICLPPLPAVLPCPADETTGAFPVTAAIGLIDAPERQAQEEFRLDLSEGNVLAIGSSLSGKTSFLQQLVRSLADRYSPEEVQLYFLDFASKTLSLLSGLNHVGGCVFPEQEDNLRTLMRMLTAELRRRRERFAALGVTSFAGYCGAGRRDLPQIVLLLDNLTAFRELCSDYEEPLQLLLRDGVSAGICIVATAMQASGISFRFLSCFAVHVAYHCNDSGEYANLLDHCRIQPRNVPGRALIESEKRIYEMQTYLAFEGEREIERAASIRGYLEKTAARFGDLRARPIPSVPAEFGLAELAQRRETEKPPYVVDYGIGFENVETVSLDLAASPLFAVSGPAGSGRANFAALVLDSLQKQILRRPAACYVLDGYDRKLASRQKLGVVRHYTCDVSEGAEMLEELRGEAAARRVLLQSGDRETLEAAPLLLLLVRNESFYTDSAANGAFAALYPLCRGLKIAFLFVNAENSPVGFQAGEMRKAIRDGGTLLFLDRLEKLRLLELPLAVLRENRAQTAPGEGFLIRDGQAVRLRTACAEQMK